MRRLLMAAGGGSAVPVHVPGTVTLTTTPHGGTNPWNIPSAYVHGGVAVIGYVNNSTGAVEAITYDGAVAGGPHTIHGAFEVDAHDGPAFARRSSDGKIVAAYTKHNSTPFNIRVSSSADDPSAWGSATNIHSQLGGTRYTDVQLYELSDGTLFLFYRDEPSAGTDSRWCYSRSTDGGTTWSAQTVLFRISSTRSYVISWKDPASDTIHFCTTNGASAGYTKLGHFTIDGLTLAKRTSSGSSISASPVTFGDLTEAYSGSGSVMPWNVVIDSAGRPVFSSEDLIGGALKYVYSRWDGSAWSSTVVATAGTGYEYNGTGTGFGSYGCWIDDGDPDVLWALRGTGQAELWKYRTYDGGATFDAQQVTTGSTSLLSSPICVRSPESWLRGYWLDGTWSTYTSWTGGLDGTAL